MSNEKQAAKDVVALCTYTVKPGAQIGAERARDLGNGRTG